MHPRKSPAVSVRVTDLRPGLVGRELCKEVAAEGIRPRTDCADGRGLTNAESALEPTVLPRAELGTLCSVLDRPICINLSRSTEANDE